MFVDVAGITARYDKVGSGPPVVILHGWGVNIEGVNPIAQCLSRTHTVFALDLPGFGQTAPPPVAWGVFDYARWIVDFLDVAGCPRTDFIGHSFGGRLAIVLACQYSQRLNRLVLVDSAGIRPPRTWRYHARVGIFRAARMLLQLLPSLEWRQKMRTTLNAAVGSADYQSAGAMRATFVRVVNEDLRPLLPAIHAPTLVVWGENDQDVPLSHGQIMAREIPNARLQILAGAGHYSYLDRLPQFCQTVREFLTDEVD